MREDNTEFEHLSAYLHIRLYSNFSFYLHQFSLNKHLTNHTHTYTKMRLRNKLKLVFLHMYNVGDAQIFIYKRETILL